ncbi:PKD domain-containing protein [Candidatus Pacearchaeota archaeon]|nr:PKD domain-containing protein [Candidatus Pacearchaeota archaeon]
MIQFLKKLSAVTLITLIVGVSSVMASGKMEVKIGNRVDFVGESSNQSVDYKWVVKKEDEILKTQTGRNFSFQFPLQGEYSVNLTATFGSKVESTTIHVLVGERYPRPYSDELPADEVTGGLPLKINLETLPMRDGEGQIRLLGDGKASFLLEQSIGNILEYRIDRNIFEDSDGNGVANDDIDNADDDSYLTGRSWQTAYEVGESDKIVAEITLVDQGGRKVKEQVQIVFDEMDESGTLSAILESSPSSDSEDKMIHLYHDPHTVSFYSRYSTGKVLEYRIDRNIFEDSDGDGNPENDIDNIDDISFKTGDVWNTNYNKTDEQIIAQLIIVGEGGKGSRVQKGVVFGEKPVPPAPTLDEVAETGIRLTSDKDFIVVGDPITFTVKGLQLGLEEYTFGWDFDGDGEVDKSIEGMDFVEHIYDLPGVFEVKVIITDQEGNSADRILEIVSKDTVLTKSNFTFEVSGNTVHFTNLSTANSSLANKSLDYQWSFGDTDPQGFEDQRSQINTENPTYIYKNAGKYIVTLTITDADDVIDVISSDIEIDTGVILTPEDNVFTDDSSAEKKGGSLFVKLLKILLYLILIVVLLIVLVVGGFLAFLKVQHPDLTFEELIDEFKAKILTMIGVHEAVSPSTPSSDPMTPIDPIPLDDDSSEESSSEPKVQPEETPPSTEESGPTPSWMKDDNVIEGETVDEPSSEASVEPVADEAPIPTDEAPSTESKPQDDNQTPPPTSGPTPETDAPASEKGPTPDWLKNV